MQFLPKHTFFVVLTQIHLSLVLNAVLDWPKICTPSLKSQWRRVPLRGFTHLPTNHCESSPLHLVLPHWLYLATTPLSSPYICLITGRLALSGWWGRVTVHFRLPRMILTCIWFRALFLDNSDASSSFWFKYIISLLLASVIRLPMEIMLAVKGEDSKKELESRGRGNS